MLVSVTVSGLLLSEDAEERQEEGAEDEDEQAEDDGVLDGRGVECERGGAVRGDRNVAETGITLLVTLDVLSMSDGQKSNSGNSDNPLHFVNVGVVDVVGRTKGLILSSGTEQDKKKGR